VRDRVGVKGVIMEFNMCCSALNFPLPQPLPPGEGEKILRPFQKIITSKNYD